MDETLARRAHALLVKAVELEPAERSTFVRNSCAGDATLARRVEDLLAAMDRSSTFLETPALGDRAALRSVAIPQHIGGYTIERVIGIGGMATVYEAMQDQPRRRVALKVMRHGLTHTSALQRFRYESEVLARLHHPNIAQIFEAGACDAGHGVTTPFFAMEYIEDATPITTFAAQRKLSLAERLEMFVAVCQAVQHGHQLGVIHRDLKPGNILVDAHGRPKVIDFGVARSADPQHERITQHTDMGQLIGTLHYMSPEQCTHENPVTIRTDVYSLGVLLYELLCGRLPHDFSNTPIPEALRVIRDVSPPPPCTHRSDLRGDLEAIIMMAMDKEPDRRYATAAALAADVRRHLQHETIEARPPTMVYRCRLFVRRHRILVVASAAVLAAIVAGGVLSTRFAYETMIESQRRLAAETKAITERDAARWQAYIANIAGSFAALQSNEFPKMRSRLAATVREHRGWEWRLLSGLSDRSRRAITVHEDMVEAFDVSHDGTTFATGSYDGSLRVWNVDDGVGIACIQATPGADVYSVSFSPDGQRVVSGSEDRSVRIWDVQTGAEVCLLGLHESPVMSVSWGPSNQIISADDGGRAHVWDANSCKLRESLTDQPNGITGVAYSDDGSYLLTWNNVGDVWLRDANLGDRCDGWNFGDIVQSAAFSSDASQVAVGGPAGKVAVWSTEEGTTLHEFAVPKNESTVQSLTFSNDGRHLAIGLVNRSIVLWSLPKEHSVEELRGHAEAVTGVWFASDDRSILSCSRDRTVRQWGIDASTETGRITTLAGHDDMLLTTAFSPDGSMVASAGRDRTIRLWDPELGQLLGVLAGHTDYIHGLAFSPDGRLLASATYDPSVGIWCTRSGRLLRTIDHPDRLWTVAFSPDGQRLATGGNDQLIRIWDASTFAQVATLSGHNARVNYLAYSPDGRLLASASRDQTVRVWNVETGEPLHLLSGHKSDVFSVAFSPDGERLFSGSRDQTVRVWDPVRGEAMGVLSGEGQLITGVAVSPDGSRLAAGSWFGEILLWDLTTLDSVASFKGHDMAIRSLAFAANGRWLATASHDKTIRLFEAAEPADRIAAREQSQQRRAAATTHVERLTQSTGMIPDELLSAADNDTQIDPELRPWVNKLLLARSLSVVE